MVSNFEVKIKMSTLQAVADYYEFPVAVFFGTKFSKGTRNEALGKIKEKYDKIKEIIEEEY